MKYLSFFLPLFLLLACTSSRKATTDAAGLDNMQFVDLPEMTVTPGDTTAGEVKSMPPYHPSRDREWDLLHTRLDLRFDIPGQRVFGEADIELTPLFFPQDDLALDADGMTFSSIVAGDVQVTDYAYDGHTLTIPLHRSMRPDETLQVHVTYVATPRATEENKATAVTSDKGLFFIDPLDTMPELPLQIWSQGETSFNRKWFPTLDQPNERQTHEIRLTVPDTLMTISNGILVESEPAGAGLRADVWRMDLPHAPYLTMIAVGQWDKVTDFWRGRPVEYYVDKGFGPSARAIFDHTPEMLEFFSDRFEYDFVWPKYAQIIVRQFVSGAMENTTAVTFGDFIQMREEDMLGLGPNDYIVAHEMMHHWFGDLVTCESWANLVLNEGFANYAEYLWFEHKYGRERADISRLTELSGYFDQAQHDAHPLVHYHYANEDAMFDAHSYNKGGLVLHMLRSAVGDDAFFASLSRYLKDHAFGSAEVDDLRQAFEEVTGKDMHWFFDPWYFGTGHPVLSIERSYDASTGVLEVRLRQQQAEKGYTPLFTLPVEIGIVDRDSVLTIHTFLLDQPEGALDIRMDAEPLAIIPDPRDLLLAEIRDEPSHDELVVRLLKTPSVNHRISAWRELGDEVPAYVMHRMAADSSLTNRRMAASYYSDRQDADGLADLASRETDPELQQELLETLGEIDSTRVLVLADRVLAEGSRPVLLATALRAKARVDPAGALALASTMTDQTSAAIQSTRLVILAEQGQADESLFLAPAIAGIRDEFLQDVIYAYARYLSDRPAAEQAAGLQRITSDHFRRVSDPQYRRYYTIGGLVTQYNEEPDNAYSAMIVNAIRDLYEQETDEYLREVLKEALGGLVD